MIIFIIYAAIIIINQQFSISGSKSRTGCRLKNRKCQKENDKLIEMINNATSVEYIEKMAREQLGLVKPGEIVYIDQSNDNSVHSRDNQVQY